MEKKHYKVAMLLTLSVILLLGLTTLSAQNHTQSDKTQIQQASPSDTNTITKTGDKQAKNVIQNKEKTDTTTNKTIIEDTSDETQYLDEFLDYGEDCSSSIVQKNENETSISFRLDSPYKHYIKISSENGVKHYKTHGSYFFHAFVTPDGWVVGNGGLDSASIVHKTEELANYMIKNKNIDSKSLQTIYSMKKSVRRGHFIIKSPNGTYAVMACFYGNNVFRTGVLKSGEYILSPNNPVNHKQGNYISYTGTTNVSQATRYISSHDHYGVCRNQITTFEYHSNGLQSNITVYISNDDGRYVGRSDRRYCSDFYIDNKTITPSQIPVIMNTKRVAHYTYNLKKLNTTTTTENLTINNEKIRLTAKVVDSTGKKVNEGQIEFKVNGLTLKDAKGNNLRVNVENGVAQHIYTPNSIWKDKFTYTANYVGTTSYIKSSSNQATITPKIIRKFIEIDTPTTTIAKTINITTSINYTKNNTRVNGGYLIYKINGVTLNDSNGKTLTTRVVNGTSTLMYKIGSNYSPNKYNLTISYINGKYRENFNTTFTVKPSTTFLLLNQKIANTSNIVLKGGLLDNSKEKIRATTKLALKINGITLKDKNNKTLLFNITNGVIDLNIDMPYKLKTGEYKLTIITQESKSYLSTRTQTTLTVK